MENKVYAIVGNWSFEANPAKGKGISLFEYHMKTGGLSLVETIRPDVAGGQLCINKEKNIIYICNECGERRGEIGGGGYIMAYQFNPQTGHLSLINEKESLCPEPSYVCLDSTGKYLLCCHCADPWHVTKVARKKDGSFTNEVLFDDAGIILFRINDDGSIGDVCDVSLNPGTGGKGPHSQVNVDPVSGHIQMVEVISRLHSIIPSPSGKIFAVCDKGMDCIYTYKIDYENEKLIKLDEWQSENVACFPRYGAFHPSLPVFYLNNENYSVLNCFHYDDDSGKLDCFLTLPLFDEDPGLVEGKPVGAQDIMVHPNGKCLYVTLCGLNLIIVLKLDENGIPKVIQRIQSNGVLPRGIQMSPDNRFLLSGNMVSGDITTFYVSEDGTLTSTGEKYDAVSPSAIRFIEGKKD